MFAPKIERIEETLIMTRSYAALLSIAITVLCTVFGQLLIKKGMLEIGAAPGRTAMLPDFLWRTFTNYKVLLGLAAAVVAAVSWTVAVSRSDLSFAYPFMGLAIVLVLAISPAMFGESVSLMRWVGVLVVCVGLWLSARG